MMIRLSSNILFESGNSRLEVFLLLSLTLPLLLDLSTPPLYLALVGLEGVRYLLDISEVAILSLQENTALLGLTTAEPILALLKHALKHFLVLLVDGLDLRQALVIVNADSIQILLVLLAHGL
jgi:hypothetical protein